MLRNHSGWAGRSSVAVLLLLVFGSAAALGGPIINVGPLRPLPPPPPPPAPAFVAPSNYSISGYVFMDAMDSGVKEPGELGLQGVTVTLDQYTMQNTSWVLSGTQSLTTNSAGYYDFGNLATGDLYSVQEVQPGGFTTTQNGLGYFLSSTGGSIAAPTGPVNGYPANGVVQGDSFDDVYLPQPTGAFAVNSKGGVYSAIDYNFGEYPTMPINTNPGGSGPPPTRPGIPVTPVGGGAGGSLQAALSVVGTDDRFLAVSSGTGAGSLNLTGGVGNPSASGTINWHISSLTGGLSLSPTSGSAIGGHAGTTLTGSVNGTGLLPGTQDAQVTVSGIGANNTTVTSTGTALIDPVYARTVTSSTASFGRVMQGGLNNTTFNVSSLGSHDQYADLTINPGSVSLSDSNAAFTGSNSGSFTFNGTTSTSPALTVSATFSNSANGPVTGSFTAPGSSGLFTNETLAGSAQPAAPALTVPYTADVLQPRVLATAQGSSSSSITASNPSGTGGYLYGAVVPLNYSVTSLNANPNSNYTSMVYVGSGSATPEADNAFSTVDGSSVGQVFTSQTLVSGGGTVSVPSSVSAYPATLGPVSGSASVSVITAEAASVHDNTNYGTVPVNYSISNVGLAAVGGVDPNNSNNQLFGAPLTAAFSSGQRIANQNFLLSAVAATGNSGSNSTTTTADGTTLFSKEQSGAPLTLADYQGTVGSSADIYMSDPLAGSANVTMAWRARTPAESGYNVTSGSPGVQGQHPSILPAGVWNLASDVVQLGGVPATTVSSGGTSTFAYALEMSYDDSINQAMDGGKPSTISGLFIAKLVNGQWTSATGADIEGPGPFAQTAVNDTLSDFLTTQLAQGHSLDQLLGSWGVDTADEISWSIIDSGGGEFAVVPEPSTIALLCGVAIAGWIAFRFRRRRVAAMAVA